MNQSQGSLFSKLLVPLIIVVIVVYLIASAWAGNSSSLTPITS